MDTLWILDAGETAAPRTAQGREVASEQSVPAPRRVFGLIRSESAGKHMETTSFAYVFPNRSIHTSYGGPPEGSQVIWDLSPEGHQRES